MNRIAHILICLVACAAIASCASSMDEPEGGEGGGGGGGGGGSGCSAGVIQGYYYFDSNDSYNCGAGYTYVAQMESNVYIGNLEASIDSSCDLHFADSSCSGFYSDSYISISCDGCIYTVTPIHGYGCINGVETGLYDVEAYYDGYGSACVSGYKELTQTGYFLSLGDLSGDIDDKCALAFYDGSGSSCVGTYKDAAIYLDCGVCTLSATKMPLAPSFGLGPYKVGYYYAYGECERPLLGKNFRLSITDAYLDSEGDLAMLGETSSLEAHDGAGNLIFSAPLNSDGTAQFSYGGETVEAWLPSFSLPYYYKPSLKVSIEPSGCDYTYSPE